MSTTVDSSFDIHPNTKGSYRRRAEDISRALSKLKIKSLPNTSAFILYYFACEKLAKIIIGISKKKRVRDIFSGKYQLHTNSIQSSAKDLGCKISAEDIEWIFSRKKLPDWNAFLANCSDRHIVAKYKSQRSARFLRNLIVHDIGPSHAAQIQVQAQFLIPKMKMFLDCSATAVQQVKSNRGNNT